MDKEKLIKALIDFYNIDGMPNNAYLDDQFEQLCNEIQNGEFDKEPCDLCAYWEHTLKMYPGSVKHCPNCGRHLGNE
jgi:hypothetical protein